VTSDGATEEGDSLLREVLGMGRRVPPAVLVPGQVVAGTYRIVRTLGAGGMGVVYLARDQRLGRDVAIKLHAAGGTARSVERLTREASAIARLTHDNVVTVYQIDSIDGQPFVAMEYVDGGTARSWLAAEPRSWRAIVALYVAAGRGLAAAHRAGLVHRDFKPDNVLVGIDGRVRVADFGLVQGAVPSSDDEDRDGAGDGGHGDAAIPSLTRTGAVLGTPAYMAPEQQAGETVGAAADQFAFAVSLWEALTGARPFTGAARGVITAPARPIPRHIEAALRRALAEAPADRWPAMDPLLAALARAPARTRRHVAGGLAIAAIAVAAVGALVWRVKTTPALGPCAGVLEGLGPAVTLRARTTALPGDRALAKVDAWMSDWRTARIDACEDTHVRRTQSLAVLELRELCLDRARTGLHATLSRLPDASDRDALVDALPPLADCADDRRLAATAPLPNDPAARAEIEAVSEVLAEVEVLRTAGQYAEATAALEAVIPRAEATQRKTLLAEALLARGTNLIASGKLDDIVATFERAAKLAAEDGDDTVAARAWLSVLDAFVARLGRPAEADRLLPVAEAAVLRAGNTDRLRSDLLGLVAELALVRGDFAAARAAYEEAIAVHERAYGQDSELARKLNRLAGIYMRLRDEDTARRHLQRAAELLERNYGPRHRHLAVIWTTLGGVEYQAGDLAAARSLQERAVALKEEVGGPASVALVPSLAALAQTLTDLGEVDAAGSYLQRALDIARKALGADHPKVVGVMRAVANNQLARGDPAGAERTLLETIATQRRIANVPPLDDIELDLARLLLGVGRLDDARAAVARARDVPRPDAETSIAAIKAHELTGSIELAAGNRAAGRTALGRAVQILREKFGPEHADAVRLQKIIDASE
jgi:tetratricopeptide (TPR) repeat protein